MSDHPSTFEARETHDEGVDWNDHATIHQAHDGQGLLDGFKALHRGTLAEMVAFIANLPEGERGEYVIQKSGDHQLGTSEILALAARPDFPTG